MYVRGEGDGRVLTKNRWTRGEVPQGPEWVGRVRVETGIVGPVYPTPSPGVSTDGNVRRESTPDPSHASSRPRTGCGGVPSRSYTGRSGSRPSSYRGVRPLSRPRGTGGS